MKRESVMKARTGMPWVGCAEATVLMGSVKRSRMSTWGRDLEIDVCMNG